MTYQERVSALREVAAGLGRGDRLYESEDHESTFVQFVGGRGLPVPPITTLAAACETLGCGMNVCRYADGLVIVSLTVSRSDGADAAAETRAA